jgi:hypothetical protein
MKTFARWRERWLRVGERLHPGEHAKTYPKTASAFAKLRAGQSPVTFASQVAAAMRARDIHAALELLTTRPGELARRLHHLLRTGNDSTLVVKHFLRVVDQLPTPLLLTLHTYFAASLYDGERARLKAYFPKGQVAKVFAHYVCSVALPLEATQQIIAGCEQTLINRFAKLPPLGDCYIAPELAGFLVPFSERSASKALRTITRGSRMRLPEADTLRFFLWWKNGHSRTDIDLSVACFDDNLYLETYSPTTTYAPSALTTPGTSSMHLGARLSILMCRRPACASVAFVT